MNHHIIVGVCWTQDTGGHFNKERGRAYNMRTPPQSQPDLAGKDLAGNNRDRAEKQVGSIWREAQYLVDR